MKRKAPTIKKPSLPVCGRHQIRYQLQGNRPVCSSCESEARAAASQERRP